MHVYASNGAIWIRHEGKGTGETAMQTCAEIRTFLLRSGKPAVLVHDAQLLESVNDEFVKQFMQFEKEMGSSILVTMGLIPNLWLRTLAKAVGALRPGTWLFCRNLQEVHERLATLVPSR